MKSEIFQSMETSTCLINIFSMLRIEWKFIDMVSCLGLVLIMTENRNFHRNVTKWRSFDQKLF
jgi:hypothetical protein